MKRDSNYVEFIYCECGCQKTIPKKNKNGRLNHFYGKHQYNYFRGDKHQRYKGRIKKGVGYICIQKPDHLFADKDGYVYEHRLVYEEYYKCCLLPWTIVHHKNGVKDDNRPENLEAMTQSNHVTEYHKKDLDGRLCYICGGTSILNKKGRLVWYKYNGRYICKKCYDRYKRPKYNM